MKTTKFSIYLAKVNESPYVAGFAEVVELLQFSISDLGYECDVVTELPADDRQLIVLAGHLLEQDVADQIPSSAIIYQFEQLPAFFTPAYEGLLRRCKVWDYAERNLDYLESINIKHGVFVPLGFHPDLERISLAEKDTDLLFYGSMSPSRKSVIDEIERRGMGVKKLWGVYHTDRDAYLAKTKAVLNLHSFKAEIHEIARTFYCLNNKIPVVSECNATTYMYPWLRYSMVLPLYQQIPSACEKFLADPKWQEDVGLAGYSALKSKAMIDTLAPLLLETYQ